MTDTATQETPSKAEVIAPNERPTSDVIPALDVSKKAESLEVLDMDGKKHTFASLYSGPDTPSRVLVVFVRHVFCGSCHAYLQSLSTELSPETLKAADASIVIIGCGDPALIPDYKQYSSTAYPMYMDPEENLYKIFNMNKTKSMGDSSTYVHDSLPVAAYKGISKMLTQVTSGLALKGGNSSTVGGDFLYEDVVEGETKGKQLTWCHFMRTTTDHTDVPGVKKLLGA